MLHVTCYMWHVTCYMWHVTCLLWYTLVSYCDTWLSVIIVLYIIPCIYIGVILCIIHYSYVMYNTLYCVMSVIRTWRFGRRRFLRSLNLPSRCTSTRGAQPCTSNASNTLNLSSRYEFMFESIDQSANESINTPINQCIDLSICWSINPSSLTALHDFVDQKFVLWYSNISTHSRMCWQVVRMSYRQLTPDEERLEAQVTLHWETFLTHIQEASEHINVQAPVVMGSLETLYEVSLHSCRSHHVTLSHVMSHHIRIYVCLIAAGRSRYRGNDWINCCTTCPPL